MSNIPAGVERVGLRCPNKVDAIARFKVLEADPKSIGPAAHRGKKTEKDTVCASNVSLPAPTRDSYKS